MATDDHRLGGHSDRQGDVGSETTVDGLRPEDSDEFREQYGYLRSYYRLRPERYQNLQRWLNQARFGRNYDAYLAQSSVYAIAAAVLGVLVGLAVTVALTNAGVVASLSNPLGMQNAVTGYLGANRTLFTGAALATLTAVALAAGTWYGRYYYPWWVVDSRRRSIDVTLPHAITFMYALSYGGMDLLAIIRVLGESQDTYGEVANEFQMIIRDVDLFGNDLYTGFQNARNLTPSDNIEQFFDDLLGVLDSGGDITVFLANQTDKYLEEARDEQRSFIETLALLSEVFVVLFVAAPLFLIVILIVMSLLGAQTLGQVTLLVYLVMPLAIVLFLVLLDSLAQPFTQHAVTLEDQHHVTTEGIGMLAVLVLRDAVTDALTAAVAGFNEAAGVGEESPPSGDTRLRTQRAAYLKQRRRRYLLESIEDPFAVFERTPALTLVATVPAAAVWLAVAVTLGLAEPSQQGILQAPRMATIWLVVTPLLLVLVPLAAFVERNSRRERRISRQFPDTMNALSSANKMGVPTMEALSLVAKWSSGPIETELRKVRNDIQWNHDTTRALRAFADRLRVPELSRAIKLVAEGMKSSSDLARVLSIAAEDTRNRFKIEQQRRRELGSYVAVVVVGYLVYLLVVALLTANYLAPIEAATATTPTDTDVQTPISISNLPVSAYEALFFHSAIIQGVGSGLLAGKLVDNRAASGLKYSILLLVVSVAAFLLI